MEKINNLLKAEKITTVHGNQGLKVMMKHSPDEPFETFHLTKFEVESLYKILAGRY